MKEEVFIQLLRSLDYGPIFLHLLEIRDPKLLDEVQEREPELTERTRRVLNFS
jgi:hypothetical protein